MNLNFPRSASFVVLFAALVLFPSDAALNASEPAAGGSETVANPATSKSATSENSTASTSTLASENTTTSENRIRNKAEDRPNVLFIFADDQRPDTIAALGNPVIKTPTLDRLVREGTSFSNAHCFGSIHGAVCQPSRAMLHSGRSLFHIKMDMSNAPLMGQLLGDSGYKTFGTGKWHNGRESFARSFQAGRTIMFGGMSDHTKVPVVDLLSNESGQKPEYSKVRPGEKFSSEMFVDSAIDFLEEYDSDDPFFCYVALTAPHDPRQPPVEYRQRYQENSPPLPPNFLPQHPWNNGAMTLRDEVLAGWPRDPKVIQQQLGEYYGLIEHADAQVGRLISTLDDLGLSENTIVVYTADHGLAMGSHGLLGKQSLYEHSMGTPLVIRGPGVPKAESRDQLVYLFDLMPTICQWTGVEIPDQVEGAPLQSVLDDKSIAGREYMFTAYTKWQRAIRDQRWKLIAYPPIQKFQLFDLESDPHEKNNLYGTPEVAEHQQRLWAKLQEQQGLYSDTVDLQQQPNGQEQIDFNKVKRKPDQWQPDWIIEKYFPAADGR